MDDLIDTVKRSAATPGGEIVVPGELENRAVDRAGGTVTLPDQTLAALAELARDAGIAPSHREPDMAYTVMVTVDVRPDRIDEFLAGITTNAIASLRDEPGCLAFDVHRDLHTPTRFYFYEIYTDENAFTGRAPLRPRTTPPGKRSPANASSRTDTTTPLPYPFTSAASRRRRPLRRTTCRLARPQY